MKKRKKQNFSSHNTWLFFFATIIGLDKIAEAQTCYDQLRLPRLIGERNDDGETWMTAIASSTPLNALFVAGMQNGDNNSTRRNGRMPVVFRMDMDQRSWRWRRSFDCTPGCQDFEAATAVAVNPQGTRVAVSASKFDKWKWSEDQFLILLYADTGHYVTTIQLYQHQNKDIGEFVVEASGIYFAANGMVYMAKNFMGPKPLGSDDGSIDEYATKFFISAFDTINDQIHYEHMQTVYFGEAMAIAYDEATQAAYFGGAVNNCLVSKNDPSCWMLAINRVDGSGLNVKQSQFTFQNNDYDDEDKYPLIDHMAHEAPWLFGTTRSNRESELGKQMFVWRCDTDAGGNPRDANLQIKFIDSGGWGNRSQVTGLRPVMAGTKIQFMLYMQGDKELRYVDFDFSSDVAKSVLIANDVLEKPFSIWHGAKTQLVDGITIYESYTAITSKKFATPAGENTKGKETGAIFPTIRDTDSCQEDTSGNSIDIDLNDRTPDTAMFFQQAEFALYANYMNPQYSRKVVEDWSVNAEEQPDEKWCSDFPPVTLEPGSLDFPNVCFEWNGFELEIPFNPFTIATPTCADPDQVIDYQVIDDNNAAGVQNEDMKITLNGETNIMRITPLITGDGSIPNNAPIQITVVGTAPDGVTSSIFTFNLVDSTCWNQVFTMPTTITDQQYYVTDIYQEYILPPFGKSRPECPEAFYNSVTPANAWITGVSDYGGVDNIVGWQTNIESNKGFYEVTVTVYDALCEANPMDATYNLEVLSQCWIQPITIDPLHTVFKPIPDISMVQDVWQTASSLVFTDAIISVPNTLLDCGPIEYKIENFDGTLVDPNVFTYTQADGLTIFDNSFTVYTEDDLQEGLHDFVITASYTDYPTNLSTKGFTIQIDPDTACEDAYTITPSAPVADLIYTIDTPAVTTLPFDEFVVDPPRCILSYTYTVTPNLPLPDVGAIMYDDVTREFTIETANIDLVYDLTADARVDQFADYTIRVNALTPEGVDTGIGFDWVTTLKSPCHDAILTLDPSNFISPIQYTAGFPAVTQTILDLDVLSDQVAATCPYGFTFDLKDQDGTNILGSVFTWTEATQEIATETYDKARIGTYPMRLHMKYDGHDYQPDNYFDFEIEVIDPCIDSATLIPKAQTDPPDYYYTGSTPKAVFTLDPFEVSPAGFCTASHTCAVSSGPRLDLCGIDDGKSTGVFIDVIGDYHFVSYDNMDQVPPGDYVFDISAVVGTTVETVQFTLRLRDPCPAQVQLSIPGTHFTDQSYPLGAPESTQPWIESDLVVSDAWVDCGTLMIDFYLADGSQSPLDGAIFEDRRAPLEFAQLQTIDFSHIGVYDIMYEVYYEMYPGNNAVSQSFEVEILEACPAPTTLWAIPSFAQEYTLTASPLSYTVSDYVVVPDPICEVDYSIRILDPNGNEYPCTGCFDPVTREFTFHYDKDLLLSGSDFADYTVEVTGTSGYLYPVTNTTSFNLKLKNPCIDPNFVTIKTEPVPAQSYILYDLNPAGHSWTHDPFTLETVPIQHDYCGDFTYEATFMGDPVDLTTLPMIYDADTRTYSIYSEDLSLIGIHPFSIEAHLTDYETTRTAPQAVKSTIEIIDPCIDPFTLTVPAQPTVDDYYYTGDTPALEFATVPFPVFPPVCVVDYSCQILSGPRLDICQVTGGQTDSFFDPVTGAYYFMSIDTANFEPGTYVMEVTGTSGLKSDTFTVELVLVDPCFTVDLGLLPNPFADQVYVLRDPAIELPWRAADDLIDPATEVDCGPITVEFFNFDGTALDGDIFLDDQTNDPDNAFRVLYSEDVAKKGSYPFRYRVYHENYPHNIVEQPYPHVVTVINSCEDPKYLKLETVLIDQEYTITQDTVTYQIPKFAIEPAWCDIIYSWEITDARGQLATQFDANMDQRVFTFFNDNDLSLAGVDYTDYTITVTADAGIETFKQDVVDFNLRIRNPCVDPDYVQINRQTLPFGLTYALWDYEPSPEGYKFTHDPFTVTTQPIDHNLCGDVRYNVYFEGQQIGPDTSPMSYDTLTREFEIYSEDWDLMGFRTIEVYGYFVDHPTMTSAGPNLETVIEIEHPCLRPAKISATDSKSPRSYYYQEGGVNFFGDDNFTVDPPVCNITYECLTVEKIDGTDDDVRCIDPDAVSFDPTTGLLNFETSDIDKYSLGQYRFYMRGTTGTIDKISADYSFIMRLASPCPYTTLRNLQEHPFADMRYVLGRAALSQPYDTKDLISADARVDCGPIVIDFIDMAGRRLDPTLFATVEDNRDFIKSDTAHQFVVISQNRTETVGEYLVRYRARLRNYPTASVAVLETPFVVRIVEQKLSDYVFNTPPGWLTELEDQYILLGANHKYIFGEKQSVFGTEVGVRVSLRRAVAFSQYDAEQNALIVDGAKTTRDDLGLTKITVEVTYVDPSGREQYFSNFFYLHIIEFTDEIAYPDASAPLNVIEAPYKRLRKQERRLDRPIPYIAHYTRTGLMTIGWDRTMQAVKEHSRIPDTQIAVNLDLLDDVEEREVASLGTRRRQLITDDGQGESGSWLDDEEYARLVKVALLDSLQLRMLQDIHSEYESDVDDFKWDVTGYTEDYIWLQVSFANPQDVGAFDSQDYIEVTFWGTEFFKSHRDVEVEFGTKLYWQIERQLSVEDADYIAIFSDWMRWLSFAVFIFVFMFVGMGGRLLPTWMYFNTMQLIVHAPLLATYMPANLNYFLLQFLGLVRFYPEPPNNEDALEREDGLENYRLSLDKDSDFSFLLDDCGYKHLFSRNLVIIIILLSACVALLIPVLLIDALNAPKRKPRRLKQPPIEPDLEVNEREDFEGGESEEGNSEKFDESISEAKTPAPVKKSTTAKRPYTVTRTVTTRIVRKKRPPCRHCACMSNFTLRVIYECFFEIFLCLLIHVSTAYNRSEGLLVFSLILFLVSLGLIVLISLLFCFKGPYMEPNVYREDSMKRSWWGARHLYKLVYPEMVTKEATPAKTLVRKTSTVVQKSTTTKQIALQQSASSELKVRPLEARRSIVKPPMTVIEDVDESGTSPHRKEEDWDEEGGAHSSRRLLTLHDVAPVDVVDIQAGEHQVVQHTIGRGREADAANDALDLTVVQQIQQHGDTPRQLDRDDRSDGALEETIIQSAPNEVQQQVTQVAIESPPPDELRNNAGSTFSMASLEPVVGLDQPKIDTPGERVRVSSTNRSSVEMQFNAESVLEKSGIAYGPSREVTPEKTEHPQHSQRLSLFQDTAAGTSTKKRGTQSSLWSQMGGYFEGGSLERSNTCMSKIRRLSPQKCAKKKKKKPKKREAPDFKKPYLHMKPYVQHKLWKRQQKMKLEAQRHVAYQDRVYKRTRRYGYRTLFYGLRKNHPHNIAVVHPVAFLLRRVLYSLIIVFMARDELNVLFGCLLLLIPTLFMLVLIVLEHEWEDRMINWQHFVNEVGIYLLICTLICFCGLIHDVEKNLFIGYIMIGVICALIVYNLIVIMYDTIRFMKLLYLRYYMHIHRLKNLVLTWLRTRNWTCKDPNDPTPACRRWARRARAKCRRDPNKQSRWRAWCFKKFQPPPPPEYESSSSQEEVDKDFKENIEVVVPEEVERFDPDLLEKPSTPLPPTEYELFVTTAEARPESRVKVAENQVAPMGMVEDLSRLRHKPFEEPAEETPQETELDWFRASRASRLFEGIARPGPRSSGHDLESIPSGDSSLNENDFFEPDDNMEGIEIEESLLRQKKVNASQQDSVNAYLSELDIMDGNTIHQTNPVSKRNSMAQMHTALKDFSEVAMTPPEYAGLELTEKRKPTRNASNLISGGGNGRMFLTDCQKPSLQPNTQKLFKVRQNNLMAAGHSSLDMGNEGRELLDLDRDSLWPQMLQINADNTNMSELAKQDQQHRRFMQGPSLLLESQRDHQQSSSYRPNTTLQQYATDQNLHHFGARGPQRNMSQDHHEFRLSDIHDGGSGLQTPKVDLHRGINMQHQRSSIVNNSAQGGLFNGISGIQTPKSNVPVRQASRLRVKKAGASIISLNSDTNSLNLD